MCFTLTTVFILPTTIKQGLPKFRVLQNKWFQVGFMKKMYAGRSHVLLTQNILVN